MKPQKALHLHEQLTKKNPNLAGKQFMIFEKYDGWYGYMDKDEHIMSRQMRAIPSMKWLSNDLAYSDKVPEGRMIFEILIEGVPEFSDLNGILNRKHEHAKDAYLMVHDFVPAYDPSMPAKDRYELAKKVVEAYNHKHVRLVERLHDNIEYTETVWMRIADRVWSRGGEGIIAKDLNAPYSPGKRNADILKIKLENSEEMQVVGVGMGRADSKYFDTLGYLVVKDKYGVTHQVSGMSDEERNLWWHNRDIINNKIVEVVFMKRLANGALREPRFKAIRHDKKELG